MFCVTKKWDINAVFSTGEGNVELAQFFGFLVLQSRLTLGLLRVEEEPVFLMANKIISPCVAIDKAESKDDVELESFTHVNGHDGYRVRIGKGAPINLFKGKEKFKNFWERGFCLSLVIKKEFTEFEIVGVGVKIGGGIEITESFLQGLGLSKCCDGPYNKVFICEFMVVICMGKKALYWDFRRVGERFKERSDKGKDGRECKGFGALGLCRDPMRFEIGF